MKHTVIIGLNIVSSIDSNQQGVLAPLREGRSGITLFQEPKDSDTRNHAWDNVKLDITGLISRKVVRFMSDASIHALLSMEQVTAGVGLSPEAYQSNPRVDLIVGSGDGSPRFQVFGVDAMHGPRGLKAVGPYVITKAMISGISACPATLFKIHGANYSISPACVTSAHCIGSAVEQIQLGEQDIMFAGGGRELCWEMARGFDAMGVLSTKHSDTPEKVSRTYDTHRDSSIIAGGGGMVVVGELEYALARGTHICVEIAGYSTTSGGADMAALLGEDAVRYMQMAMYGIDISISYLNSHDTSTPAGDMKELVAIREMSGDRSPAIPAIKATTSRPLGAADVQEAIYSLLMLEHGFITPNINIEESDEQAAGLDITTEATGRELTTVMSNGFGLGGINATLMVRKLED